jgi:prefoldin subunit 5
MTPTSWGQWVDDMAAQTQNQLADINNRIAQLQAQAQELQTQKAELIIRRNNLQQVKAGIP